ncbi:cation transporter [Candidatus Micrarchaeota archaeon]|nr:cation transporter [Candidatus Micrarchaeota archaeon]
MKYELELHGMHCESCGKIVERVVSRHAGAKVGGFSADKNTVVLECGDGQLPAIQAELKKQGYQLLLPGDKAEDGYEAGSLKRGLAFVSDVIRGAPGFSVEHRLFRHSLLSFLVILAVQALLYALVFRSIPKFLDSYWSVALLSAVSAPMLVAGAYHAQVFRKRTGCMTGMMIGMTFGMAAGFIIGAFAGATNGMFVGSLVGVFAGMGFGYITGRCCGVMGVLEGMTGGLMAGTMGAMLSVMMVYDHLIPFLFILTGIEIAIMWAFSYMLYKEYGSIKESTLGENALAFVAYALALDLALTFVFVFAPKAGVVLGR